MRAKTAKGGNGVGRVEIQVEVANYDDLALVRGGALPKDQVRRQTIQAVVDTGAAKLVLPEKVVKELGLPRGNTIKVRCADGRRAQRRGAEGVYLEMLGRHGTFSAIVEPKRETALLGAIVLEDLDFIVDCQKQRVVPRDPAGPVFEVE